MKYKYPHLLSPMKVGNTVFRNRLFSAPNGIHALQGGEPYPTQAIIDLAAERAKGGAACVTCHGVYPFAQNDGEHLAYDGSVLHNQHYISQLADAIHFYGAKASLEIMGQTMNNRGYYDVVAGLTTEFGPPGVLSMEMTEEVMDEIADNFAESAYIAKICGFDMCMVHMAYGTPGGGRFISPHFNKRTDKYGGSLENRLRFPIMVFDRIKQRCGKDFLIEFRVSGAEPQFDDGITKEDTLAMSKILEGHVDLLHLHGNEMWEAHPTCFAGPAPFVPACEYVKKNGSPIPVVAIGGLQDLDEAEEIIASGKADFVSIARGWIADPELGLKAYEGRPEDVVPCIKCLRCHDSGCLENKVFVCSVNPEMGVKQSIAGRPDAPKRRKRVAVIGGGPAGMEAAMTAARRGHDVTLYEKNSRLGGQLNFADYAEFKYGLRKFKNYLMTQLEKAGVKIRLNTKATPEMIEGEGYDEVITALGADPVVPPIPGIDSSKVITALNAFGNEDKLGSSVLVLGGGQVGCESAVHLARCGKKVDIVEMLPQLAPDASPTYRIILMRRIEAEKNIKVHTSTRCVSIGDAVVCEGPDGRLSFTPDTVILAAGMRAKQTEALSFFGAAPRTLMAGDCERPGNVAKAVRSAYGAASQL
ncbi:MAG: FAD-dependent oxidoreductase [Oscillospiraceae bacterium]